MTDLRELVPPHVRALGDYVPGKSRRAAEQESGIPCIKLASNENPFGPSPLALAAMREAMAEANLYPENDAPELRHALAARHGVRPEQVLVTPGSTGFLNLVARTLLAPGLNAVTSRLSFVQYAIVTRAMGAALIEVPMRDLGYDLDGIAAAINPDTRLVFLANPNNPTGTMFEAAPLDRFLKRIPEHVIVVIDEAYYEFAQYFAERRHVEYSHSINYVREGRNAIVLRTFSKAHGLGGMRIGYGIGPAELIGYCARLFVTFSVSSVAQAAALAALQDEAHIQKTLNNNAEGIVFLRQSLQDLGYQPIPAWTNFLYCDVGEDSLAVGRRLQQEGVIVRPLKPWGAPNAIRITVGTPEENRIFVAAFRKAMRPAIPR